MLLLSLGLSDTFSGVDVGRARCTWKPQKRSGWCRISYVLLGASRLGSSAPQPPLLLAG